MLRSYIYIYIHGCSCIRSNAAYEVRGLRVPAVLVPFTMEICYMGQAML